MVIAIAVAAAVGAAIWELPHRLVDPHKKLTLSAAERMKAENDVRTTIVQALVGSGVVAGLYFSARTLRLGAGSLKVSAETLALNRDADMVDRFTKAVDQLGNTSADVRMGAIYTLERVARDSPGDHPTVMEVLSAYVREHSTIAAASRGDLQAAVTVIGRRQVAQDPPGWTLSLEGADLRGLDLRGAMLRGAKLQKANLRGALLDDGVLADAKASRALLQDARLVGAHLESIDLTDSHLERATLTGAQLQKAHLEGAYLDGAVLLGAQLQEAVFTGAHHLDKALLDGANTEGAIDLPT